MQQRETGSITHDKVHHRYRAFVVTPNGKRISKRFKNKADAVEWNVQQIADISRNNFVEPNNILFGE